MEVSVMVSHCIMERAGRRYTWVCDEILENIFRYIESPCDRASISEVNKQWNKLERSTRRCISIRFTYAVQPWYLSHKFANIDTVTIKGKPRVCDWGVLGNSWGGSGDVWVRQLVRSYASLRAIHLRRLDLCDLSLHSLAYSFPQSLEFLELIKCSGFSTAGILSISSECRRLRVLRLKESIIADAGEEWIHVLAQNNKDLEVLDFSLTGLEIGSLEDLATLIKNCKALKCLKLGEVRTSNLAIVRNIGILSSSRSIHELLLLYRSLDNTVINQHFDLPKNLTSFAGDVGLPVDSELFEGIRKLDLMLCTLRDCHSHLEVIKFCANLEELKIRNVIGDEGIDAIARYCKNLKKIRIENLEDQHGFVSQRGLSTLATSCTNLQSVAIYTSDLDNASLVAFGKYCPHLYNFRVAVLDSPEPLSDLPLDHGMKALLQGCRKLRKLALYLKPGGLSDEGLCQAGELACNLEWVLLGCAGYSDSGLLGFAKGCHKLRTLEMRHCPFTEAGVSQAINLISTLTYVWCQGYIQVDPRYLLALGPAWIIEYMPCVEDDSLTQFLVYRSLSGPRCDNPPEVFIVAPE